jgi:hypothetical protein
MTPRPNTVEVVASVNCQHKCIAVSRAFVEEHARWGEALIIAEADLRICRNRVMQLER